MSLSNISVVVLSGCVGIALAAPSAAIGWDEPTATSVASPTCIEPLARVGGKTAGFEVTCFAVAPGGDAVALGNDDGIVRLWSLTQNKLVRTIDIAKNGYIGSIAFSPDGKFLALHADDHPVMLYDAELGVERGRWREDFVNVDQIRFAPSGRLVGLIADDSAFLWDIDKGTMRKCNPPARSLAFSLDNKTIALGFNTVVIVDVDSGKSVQEFGKTEGQTTSLEFSPDGGELLAVDSGCRGTTVRRLEIASGDETTVGEKIQYERVGATYSPDGKIIVVNDGFSQAIVWEADTGRKLKTLSGFHRDASALVFTQDNRLLVSGRGDTNRGDLLVWNAAEVVRATGTGAK
jgi:WD40 repeat protein